MPKTKPPQMPTDPDTVELSNIAQGHADDPSSLEALRELAQNRAKRIVELETERDELARRLREVHGRKSPAEAIADHGAHVDVDRIELMTAPEHCIVLRVKGELDQLEALRRELQQQRAAAESAHTDGVTVALQAAPS